MQHYFEFYSVDLFNYGKYVLQEGNSFMSAVFNETVNIVEPDEGLDGETYVHE